MAVMDVLFGIGFLTVLFTIISVGLSILAFVFWILMIIDCAKRKFKDDSEKIIWIVVILLAGFIGALIYYFVVKRKNKK